MLFKKLFQAKADTTLNFLGKDIVNVIYSIFKSSINNVSVV